MKVIKTTIKDVVIIEPDVFGDARGYFFESYSQKKFDEQIRPVKFVQDNRANRSMACFAVCISRRARMRRAS